MDVVRSSMLHVTREIYTMGRDGGSRTERESKGSMGPAHGPSATAPTRARTAEIAGPVAAAAEMGLMAHCFGFAL